MSHYIIDTGLTRQDVMEELARTSVFPETCSVEGCERRHYAKELCNAHYWRYRRTGSLDPARPIGAARRSLVEVCEVDGCSGKRISRTFCNVHRCRFRRWLKAQAVGEA